MDIFNINFKEWFSSFPITLIPRNEYKNQGGFFKLFHAVLEENEVPNCPKCNSPMVLRRRNDNGMNFWGCSRFSKGCRGFLPYSEKRAAAQASSETIPAGPVPTCPDCNIPMRLINGRNGPFYGCPNYSKGCRQTKNATSAPSPAAESPSFAKQSNQLWYVADVISNQYGLSKGQKVAIAKLPNANWEFNTLDDDQDQGVIPNDKVASVIKAIRDEQGNPVKSTDLDSLLKNYKTTKQPKSNLIPEDKMSAEQRKIEERFAKIINEPGVSHMMISALAGTGKTTVLKHLAWKFSKPGQKWLYLVFNSKNQVEAKEKFPPLVTVKTSHSFLGEVLQDPSNVNKLPPTNRIATIQDEDEDGLIDKSRLMADSDSFLKEIKKLGLPAGRYNGEDEYVSAAVNSLCTSMRYQFKEEVLRLVGLMKNFAINPKNQTNLKNGIEKIFNNYDFETTFSDVAERIRRYSNAKFKQKVINAMQDFLGYDVETKDFKEEIINASVWLIEKSLPHGTDEKIQNTTPHEFSKKTGKDRRNRDLYQHNLGHFRDFDDDLWFASVHADEINWPHYDVVLADEVQDFNEAQKIMLKKLAQTGAKVVAVGDQNQSLYKFRGADGKAFSNIGDMLENMSSDKNVHHTLSKNFRSRKAIIDMSNNSTHVKNLQHGKNDDGDPGKATMLEVNYDDSFKQLKQEKDEGYIKPTAYISRTNEPIIHVAMRLLADNVPFIIVGKDIAKDIKKHINKVTLSFKLRDDNDYIQLSEKLGDYNEGQKKEHAGASTKKAHLQMVNETTKALQGAIAQYDRSNPSDRSIGAFRVWLLSKLKGVEPQTNEKDLNEYKRRMKREKPVVLTTSHKSKGLEFERVYVLRWDLYPHPRTNEERPDDVTQEENARYVTLTRGMDELHVLKLKGQPGYKDKDGEGEE